MKKAFAFLLIALLMIATLTPGCVEDTSDDENDNQENTDNSGGTGGNTGGNGGGGSSEGDSTGGDSTDSGGTDDGSNDGTDGGDDGTDNGGDDGGSDDDEPGTGGDDSSDGGSNGSSSGGGSSELTELTAVIEEQSGWIEADNNSMARMEMNVTLPHEMITSITLHVVVEDSDEEHAETDEGSDPDEVDIRFQTEECGNMTYNLTTPVEQVFHFDAEDYGYSYVSNVWDLLIKAECHGGKPAYVAGMVVYIDQGVYWNISGKYTYLGTSEGGGEEPNTEPSPSGIQTGVIENQSGWADANDEYAKTQIILFLNHTNIIEVTLNFTILDSDEDHAETDEGSDPDRIEIEVENGDINTGYGPSPTPVQTQIILPEEGSDSEYLSYLVNITIMGDCQGGKPAYTPAGFLVYIDQGFYWEMNGYYKYEA